MNRRNKILIITTMLFTLPFFAVIKSNADESQQTPKSEKCSVEIEGLKLCAESSKIVLKLGEPITINLIWSNSFGIEHPIGGSRSSIYSITVIDEKGEKVLPVYQQRERERQKRVETSGEDTITDEDIKEIMRRLRGGSDVTAHVVANQTRTDIARLTDKTYDYDLTKKGKYRVTISRKVPSFEYEKTIELVIEDIEIEIN